MNDSRRKEYIERLKDLQKRYDPDNMHYYTAEILTELLTELGFEDIVKEYEMIEQ